MLDAHPDLRDVPSEKRRALKDHHRQGLNSAAGAVHTSPLPFAP